MPCLQSVSTLWSNKPLDTKGDGNRVNMSWLIRAVSEPSYSNWDLWSKGTEIQHEVDHLQGLLLVSKHCFYLFVCLLFICRFCMRLAFTRFPTEIFFHLSLLLRSFSCLNERKHFSKAWWVNEINYTWRLSAKVKPCSLDAWSDITGLCDLCTSDLSS